MGSITNREARQQIFQKTNGFCVHCGDILKNSWHVDHFHPQSKGGLDIIENLLPSCSSCNTRKRDMVPSEDDSAEYLNNANGRIVARQILCIGLALKYEETKAGADELDALAECAQKFGYDFVLECVRDLAKYGPEIDHVPAMVFYRAFNEKIVNGGCDGSQG